MILPSGFTIAICILPSEIQSIVREKANPSLFEKDPVKWYAGIAIILLWLGIAYLVIDRWVLR